MRCRAGVEVKNRDTGDVNIGWGDTLGCSDESISEALTDAAKEAGRLSKCTGSCEITRWGYRCYNAAEVFDELYDMLAERQVAESLKINSDCDLSVLDNYCLVYLNEASSLELRIPEAHTLRDASVFRVQKKSDGKCRIFLGVGCPPFSDCPFGPATVRECRNWILEHCTSDDSCNDGVD